MSLCTAVTCSRDALNSIAPDENRTLAKTAWWHHSRRRKDATAESPRPPGEDAGSSGPPISQHLYEGQYYAAGTKLLSQDSVPPSKEKTAGLGWPL